jgi:hypothetical protein
MYPQFAHLTTRSTSKIHVAPILGIAQRYVHRSEDGAKRTFTIEWAQSGHSAKNINPEPSAEFLLNASSRGGGERGRSRTCNEM